MNISANVLISKNSSLSARLARITTRNGAALSLILTLWMYGINKAISMGCNVGCHFIGRAFDDNWGLEDSTGKSDEEFKKIIKEIESKIKVDWHNNKDIHNELAQYIEDTIYTYKSRKNIDLSFDEIDLIIEEIIGIALIKY